MPSTDTVPVRDGAALRAAITKAGLSLVQVAEAAEVSPTWVSHLCSDRSRRRRVSRHTALVIGGLVSPLTRELFVLDDNSQSGQSDPQYDSPEPD